MTKFVSIFRELGSFNELLGTQVELILVEKLQHTWLKVGTQANCSLIERGMHCLREPAAHPAEGGKCV